MVQRYIPPLVSPDYAHEAMFYNTDSYLLLLA